MFLFFPYTCIFIFFLILRTLIIISAPNWLMAWLAIELNLLRFIPLIIRSKFLHELEAATKYLFAQRLGRILILLSAFSSFSWAGYLAILGLFLKLGLAPLHFWFPATIAGISWEICILISTWQKFPILALLCSLPDNFQRFLLLAGALSTVVARALGLNQTQLRTLLAYSSIAHTGWVVGLISVSTPASWLYFCIYTVITIATILFLRQTNALFFWSVTSPPLILFLLFLSLRGLPPLSGFAIKLGAISLLSTLSIPLTLFIVFGSLLRLYFYLNLRFNFIFCSFAVPVKTLPSTSYSFSFLSSFSLFSFFLIRNLFILLCALILCNKSQGYRNLIFYPRHLIWSYRHFHKTINSSRTRATWIPTGEGPTL